MDVLSSAYAPKFWERSAKTRLSIMLDKRDDFYRKRGKQLGRLLFEVMGIRKNEAAAIMDVSRTTLDSWLDGKPPQEALWAAAIDRLVLAHPDKARNIDSLLHDTNPLPDSLTPIGKPAPKTLPYRGTVSAGQFTEPHDGEEEWEVPEKLYVKGGYILSVDGDSMHPTLVMGEYIIVEPTDAATINDVVVVMAEGGRTTVKRLKFDSKASEYILQGDNPKDAPVKPTECRIIAKARWGYHAL